jgi:hypothetical protein
MRAFSITLSLALVLAGCATRLPVSTEVTTAGSAPAKSTYRLASQGVGQQPGDFLVRSQVESRLAAKGFTNSEQGAKYVVEVSVTARPLGVGADDNGRAVLPATGGLLGHVCSVRLRFTDLATAAEVWRVQALEHGAIDDCNTENFRLVEQATNKLP